MLAGWSAAAQTPEEMYQEYMTPETEALMERFDEVESKIQEAEDAERGRKTLALVGAILIGLIPLGVIGRRIIQKKSWKDNPSGTVKALGIGILGGAVLFALNYGIFLLTIKMGNDFPPALAFLIVAALIAGSIFLLKKKTRSNGWGV